MKDKNKEEIKAGDLVKRCGNVEYADGKRFKVSKKTWLISRVEKDKLYFGEGEEETELARPKDEGDFIVVGNEKKGIEKEYLAGNKPFVIDAGSVGEKYRVLKDVPAKDWKKGDVVHIVGKVSFETLHSGWLEKVDKDTPHKHVLIVVDPVLFKNNVNT